MTNKSTFTKLITLVVVDDHHLVREGLETLLAGNPMLKVVGGAGDGHAALDIIAKCKPDILLLDLMLPGMQGLDILSHITRPTRVIAISVRCDELYVAEALKKGAAAYLTKDCSATELFAAIDAVMNKQRFLSRSLNQRRIDQILTTLAPYGEPYESLTLREQLVLQFAAEGLSSSEIGARLFISPRTVEFHRANIIKKLGFRSQTDLIKFAIRKGITAP